MNIAQRQQSVWELPAGTIIRVRHDWYYHVGLIGDRIVSAERSVLAFSADTKGFVEQPYSEFAKGRDVTADGYPGCLPAATVLQRARAIRDRPYSWAGFNCEHFVRHAHGLPVESPQLREWTILASIVGLLACVAARS
ncbi:MAG: hypothetical protein HRU81_04570 [Gammaproteobacteria bacterium]|nr:MAG: hypothetical protein HRU81_04570 [Gammaproteobacteria bacterium]